MQAHKCLSGQSLPSKKAHTNCPQPSPPTHGSQSTDDSHEKVKGRMEKIARFTSTWRRTLSRAKPRRHGSPLFYVPVFFLQCDGRLCDFFYEMVSVFHVFEGLQGYPAICVYYYCSWGCYCLFLLSLFPVVL